MLVSIVAPYIYLKNISEDIHQQSPKVSLIYIDSLISLPN